MKESITLHQIAGVYNTGLLAIPYVITKNLAQKPVLYYAARDMLKSDKGPIIKKSVKC